MKDTFKERLRKIMDEKQLRQVDIVNAFNEFCKRNHIDNCCLLKGQLSSYLKGGFEPNSQKIAIFAKIFDVSEAWLLGYDVDKGEPSLNYIQNDLLIEFDKLTELNKAKLKAYIEGLLASQEDN